MNIFEIVSPLETNLTALDEQLRLNYPTLVGLSQKNGNTYAIVPDEMTQTEIDSMLAFALTLDPDYQTDYQIIVAESEAAKAELAGIITNRIDWHELNPATSTNAVEVLQRIQVEWVYFMKLLRADLS